MGCSSASTIKFNPQYPPIEPDININEKFKKIRKIGAGSFGDVYLIKSQETQREFSLKLIKLKGTKAEINKILGEVNILQKLHHPNNLFSIDLSPNFF